MAAKGRLTREDWIAYARKALVASGIDDVKVDVLAKRMRVTRGSFYWHFKHRQELLDALLEDWKNNNDREIDTIKARASEEGGDLIELFRIWLGEDPSYPSFDFAIRSWARKSKKVASAIRETDDAWIALFQDYFERNGMKDPESLVRARIMYFHQVGYFALSIEESLSERARLAPHYYTALTGAKAPEGMVDTMLALEQKKPKSKKAPQWKTPEKATTKA
ncbi:MAG: TetR/AcrR family transcriptional regulator [Sphingobium sp.]